MNREQLQTSIIRSRMEMEKAARELDFIAAARHRDELHELECMLAEKK